MRRRTRFLDDAQLATFLRKLDVLPEIECDVLHLAVLLGCRTGELVAVRAGDVRDGKWMLHETKSGEARSITLPPQARAIFDRYPSGFGIEDGPGRYHFSLISILCPRYWPQIT